MCALKNGNATGTNGQSAGLKSTTSRSLVPGIYVPTVAFFKPDESVDIVATEKHAATLSKTGIAGLVSHGSNGEAVHLDHEERKAISAATRRAMDSAGFPHMPLIVGCGAQSTRETIQLCKDAAESGGDYVLILPPSYYSGLVSSDLLLEHFKAVADASPLPLLIYNFPGAASGLDLNSDQILSLAEHPNIVGTKLTCGNTGKLTRIANSAKPGFLTMGGSADFILQTLIAGGHGVIAGLGNLAPRACVRTMELYNKGNLAGAQKLQSAVARGDWHAIKGGFVAVKAALEAFEGYGGVPRRPCVAPDEAGMAAIKKNFSELINLEKTLQ